MPKEWFSVAWLQDAPIRASSTQSYFRFPKIPKLRVGIARQIEDNCRDVCVVRATATEFKAFY